jgi:hypothetical protein
MYNVTTHKPSKYKVNFYLLLKEVLQIVESMLCDVQNIIAIYALKQQFLELPGYSEIQKKVLQSIYMFLKCIK